MSTKRPTPPPADYKFDPNRPTSPPPPRAEFPTGYSPSPTPPLSVRCLAYLPLPKEQVESIWSGNTSFDRQESMLAIAQLCLSHERLRAELEGLEILLKTVAP